MEEEERKNDQFTKIEKLATMRQSGKSNIETDGRGGEGDLEMPVISPGDSTRGPLINEADGKHALDLHNVSDIQPGKETSNKRRASSSSSDSPKSAGKIGQIEPVEQ